MVSVGTTTTSSKVCTEGTTTTTTSNHWNYRTQLLFGDTISCILPNDYIDVSMIRQVPDHQECYISNSTNTLFVFEILEYQQQINDNEIVQFFFNDLAESNGIDITNTISSIQSSANNNNNSNKTDDIPRIVSFQSTDAVSSCNDSRQQEPPQPGMMVVRPPMQLIQQQQQLSSSTSSSMEIEDTNNNNNDTDDNLNIITYRSGYGIQRIRPGKDRTSNTNQLETIYIHLFVIRLVQYNTDILITLTKPELSTISSSTTIIENNDVLQQQQQQQLYYDFQQIISSVRILDVSLFG